MTEQQIKELCKLVIENGNRDFTEIEKEMLKAAVDQSRNWQELFAVAVESLGMGKKGSSQPKKKNSKTRSSCGKPQS